jgi:riboflavin kinase / FMN adenylyltransferase
VRTLVGLDSLTPPADGSAVTIGTFDGVHVGHQALIARTVGRARALGAAAVVLTWDRHPAVTLRPHAAPRLLASPERKVELLLGTNADLVGILPFTRELSRWPPERFVEEVLVTRLGARAVIVGSGWRFGHRASGDVELLAKLGAGLGFETEELGLTLSRGQPVSSTGVRAAVAAGDLDAVRSLLGRRLDVDGMVVEGRGRGKGLGFPTANLHIDPGLALPPLGIYAGRALVAGSAYGAAVSIGTNPHFEEPSPVAATFEAHLVDFEGDLYGHTIRVELWARLRDERPFATTEALKEQIARDVEATRRLTC